MNEMKIQVICCTIIGLTDNITSTSQQSDVWRPVVRPEPHHYAAAVILTSDNNFLLFIIIYYFYTR